ncbi:VOC family protein [Nocardioides sp. GXZ039]|uniref:VOC family protein n=1 Tax=Nocardioides sp. GXZ039 TaxID=3136018 RepID=UPI0030F3CCF1
MASRLRAVTSDAADPALLARFWAAVLGRPDPVWRGSAAFVLGSGTQVGLEFRRLGDEPAGGRRLHLHVTSDDTDQESVVAAALALGATHLDVGQQPDEGHIVLADPEGNAFCVIEEENSYLAGCGPLGEVACDGTRAVGLFWSAALDWPLVWDENEETAIQSPDGGTKVAWGGPPVQAKDRRNPEWFELVTDRGSLDEEVDRLVSLGASVLTRTGASAVLADPDGNEFSLSTD